MSTDRPATEEDEIEVTPEMIKAGLMARADHSQTFYDREEIVSRIYVAMYRARRTAVPHP